MSATKEDTLLVIDDRLAWIVVVDAGQLFLGAVPRNGKGRFMVRVFLDWYEAALEVLSLEGSSMWEGTLAGWCEASQTTGAPLVIRWNGQDRIYSPRRVPAPPSAPRTARGPPAAAEQLKIPRTSPEPARPGLFGGIVHNDGPDTKDGPRGCCKRAAGGVS